MHEGVNQLMKHHHIDIYNGIGRIMGTSIFSPQILERKDAIVGIA